MAPGGARAPLNTAAHPGQAGAAPDTDHGGVAAAGPGAGGRRRHRESGLILEDGPGVERRHGPSTLGQVSFPPADHRRLVPLDHPPGEGLAGAERLEARARGPFLYQALSQR